MNEWNTQTHRRLGATNLGASDFRRGQSRTLSLQCIALQKKIPHERCREHTDKLVTIRIITRERDRIKDLCLAFLHVFLKVDERDEVGS